MVDSGASDSQEREAPSQEDNNVQTEQTTSAAKMTNSERTSDQSTGFQLKKVTFQVKLFWTLYSMFVYVNKLYEDCNTVAVFYNQNSILNAVLTGLCLILPTVAYLIYVVTDQLNKKMAVPEVKEVRSGTVHGLLLIPWQIKSRADQLYYISQKSCQVRAPTNEEENEISNLEKKADVLGFFEEFIAGFIQLILQLYLLTSHMQTGSGDYPITTQLVASGLALISMILAVKRKDDGILTGSLSTVGWSCMFFSRTFAIALGASVIHSWIVLFCALHVLAVTVWVSKIAFDSYQQQDQSTVLSRKMKTSIIFLVFTLFGFPSLTYWPIMFQLKEAFRLQMFVALMVAENVGLFLLWYFLGEPDTRDKYVIRFAVLAGLCVVGGMFILLYKCCKPSLTDKVVLHDMTVENCTDFGLYFDFCNATFNLPEDVDFHRLLKEVRQTPTTK